MPGLLWRAAAALLTGATLLAPGVARADERELLARIERQDAEIAALKKQVQDLAAILDRRAAKPETRTEGGETVSNGLVPRIESAKGDYSLQVVGNLQLTAGFHDQDNSGPRAPALNNGVNVRRAQLGVVGTAYKEFTYTSIFDLSANGGVASAVRDLTVAYRGFAPFTFTIGNQKPQNGLEASFSDRSNAQTFIESSMTSDLATALSSRYIGARVSTGDAHYSASLGLFGDDINSNGVAVPARTGWGVHGRLTYAPLADADKLLHFGISGYWRRVAVGRATAATDPLVSQLRFRSRPELTVDGQRLVDTGNLASARNARFLGGEFAGVYGPIGLQSEYQRVWVNQGSAKLGLSFDGAYVEGSYILTGESRSYDVKTGVFTRFRPRVNFDLDRQTWGAFEVAARVSFVDYNDSPDKPVLGGIKGGFETDYTGAFNWYWNPYFRLQVNYIRANIRNGGGALAKGTDANIIALRAHQEW